MFDYLYEWMRNLAFYLVLVTAVIHMIPHSDYKKYIRFFTGIVLVLLLLTPILKIFGMEQKVRDLYQNPKYEEKLREIQMSTDYLYKIDTSEYLTEAAESTTDEDKAREQEAADAASEYDSKIKVEEIRIGQ